MADSYNNAQKATPTTDDLHNKLNKLVQNDNSHLAIRISSITRYFLQYLAIDDVLNTLQTFGLQLPSEQIDQIWHNTQPLVGHISRDENITHVIEHIQHEFNRYLTEQLAINHPTVSTSKIQCYVSCLYPPEFKPIHNPQAFELAHIFTSRFDRALDQAAPQLRQIINSTQAIRQAACHIPTDCASIQDLLRQPDSETKLLQLVLAEYQAPHNWQQAINEWNVSSMTTQPQTLYWFLETVPSYSAPTIPNRLDQSINSFLSLFHSLSQLNRTLNEQPPYLAIAYHQTLQTLISSNDSSHHYITAILEQLEHNNQTHPHYLLTVPEHPSLDQPTLLSSYIDLLNTIANNLSPATTMQSLHQINDLLNSNLCQRINKLPAFPATWDALHALLSNPKLYDQSVSDSKGQLLLDQVDIFCSYWQCLPHYQSIQTDQPLSNQQRQAQDLLYDWVTQNRFSEKQLAQVITQVPQAKYNLWHIHKQRHSNSPVEADQILKAKHNPAQSYASLNATQQALYNAFNIQRHYTSPQLGKGIYAHLALDSSNPQLPTKRSSFYNWFKEPDSPRQEQSLSKSSDPNNRPSNIKLE